MTSGRPAVSAFDRDVLDVDPQGVRGVSAALRQRSRVAKAAAACGIPVGYVQPSPHGSRIGMPDVPKRGDMWHVKKTSPVSPGMIIYWPDGGAVLCR